MKTQTEINKLKNFLQKGYPNIQAFNSACLCGDYRICIYHQDGIEVLYAPYYEYIEIYGLEENEFEDLIEDNSYDHLKTFEIV